MTIKQLMAAIQGLPETTEVILQKDGEGNGYSPLAGVMPNCVYVPENTWSGEAYNPDWSADDANMTEPEWNKIKLQNKVVVLVPTN